MNLQPGTRGCCCHSPHSGGGGSRGGDGAGGSLRGSCPAGQRGSGAPERARATGGGRRAGICWIYGPSHDVFMAGMGQPQLLPSPALLCTPGPCSASSCRRGGGSQVDFALRGGAPRGSPWHGCRVCPVPGSSTAPSLRRDPVLPGPGAALVLSPPRHAAATAEQVR